MQGIINVFKPQGYTSHDCVAIVRRRVGIKKVGHGGTLDPMAQGVLPIFIGSATRMVEYMDGNVKTYVCETKLGMRTNTLDIWGEILDSQEVYGIDEDDVIQCLRRFQGEIDQVPPIFSAIKKDGKKLYEYGRQGIEVDIKPRKVNIFDIHFDFLKDDVVGFTVICSGGTYIRSICRDLGEALGCGSAMSALTRVKNGVFSIENSISIEDIKTMDGAEIMSEIYPVDYPIDNMCRIEFTASQGIDFIDGKEIVGGARDLEGLEDINDTLGRPVRVYVEDLFIGIGMIGEGYSIRPKKVFFVDKVALGCKMRSESI